MKRCKICSFLKKYGEYGIESEWLSLVRDGRMRYDGLRAWLEMKGVKVSKRTIQRHLHSCTPKDYEIRIANQEARKRHSKKEKSSLVLEKEHKKYTLRELGYGVLSRRKRNEGLE